MRSVYNYLDTHGFYYKTKVKSMVEVIQVFNHKDCILEIWSDAVCKEYQMEIPTHSSITAVQYEDLKSFIENHIADYNELTGKE